jgi:hypothetical protein
MKPVLAFAASFGAALVLAGATGARTHSFQTANCNLATAQSTPNLTRDGALNYAYVAAYEGYQWGGGCWNNDDVDSSYGDPVGVTWPQGEGGDCSGLTFKTWRESLDTANGGHYYWAPLRNVHGPYTAQSFKYGYGTPNGTLAKSTAGTMDGFASDTHVGMIFFPATTGGDDIVEAKCEYCGTNTWYRTYRSDSSYGGIRRLGWTG